jgi:predicted MFS family arabinose efflux permease
MSNKSTNHLPGQLTLLTLARFLLNTALRMVYPFAPAFARGLGVPVTDIYQLITLRSLIGVISPLFSPLSERYGRVPIMALSMLLFGLGATIVILWPAYWALGLTLSIFGIAKVIYDPAMQSYLGERVPYAQRGRALSVTELAWSGALIVGAPAISLLITRWGWQAPFFWLAIFGLIAAVALWRLMPRLHTPPHGGATNLAGAWRIFRQYRVIWAASLFIALSATSNETLFIVFGGWMEANFGLSLIALGFSAGLIGLAEITGEISAGWSVDRFGKRPVIIATGFINAFFCFVLPYASGSLTAALIAYFFVFLFFEITVVGSMPLMTEIVPSGRSVVMSVLIAASALGRAGGATLGPWLFTQYGYLANGIAAALMMAIAIGAVALWVRESPQNSQEPNPK